jgi:5-methylcytosine-specific restriction endonuclease McrA
MKMPFVPKIPLKRILVKKSSYQSYKLKNCLFREGLKQRKCEICGWAKKSPDGRKPLELDHINGDSQDNRLENLRILCPNCHSLQPTHRGRNRK